MNDRELLQATLDDADTLLLEWQRTQDPDLMALAVRALLDALRALVDHRHA